MFHAQRHPVQTTADIRQLRAAAVTAEFGHHGPTQWEYLRHSPGGSQRYTLSYFTGSGISTNAPNSPELFDSRFETAVANVVNEPIARAVITNKVPPTAKLTYFPTPRRPWE